MTDFRSRRQDDGAEEGLRIRGGSQMHAPRKEGHPVRLLGANEFARRFQGDAASAETLADDELAPPEQIVPPLTREETAETAPAIALFRRARAQVAETAELIRQSAQLVSRSRPRRWRRAA